MQKIQSNSLSTYIQYLPAILKDDKIINQFLLGFEDILTSNKTDSSEEQKAKIITNDNLIGLETIIEIIHKYFDPQETPTEFLPWLAGWVGLSLRNDWSEDVKRAFILKMVTLYRLRGTKTGLQQILALYLNPQDSLNEVKNVEIFEFEHFANYFQVQLSLSTPGYYNYWQQMRIAKAIIDQEKPAHTFYSLRLLVETMRITTPGLQKFTFHIFGLEENKSIELTATLTVTNSENQQIDKDVLNKLMIRFYYNDYSYLFTPETEYDETNGNKIIKETISELPPDKNIEIIINNYNNYLVSATLKVEAKFILNSTPIPETELLPETEFTIAGYDNYLKIYTQDSKGRPIEEDSQIDKKGNTFLGTKVPEKPTMEGVIPSDYWHFFKVVTVNSDGTEAKRERGKNRFFREYLGDGTFLDMMYIPGGEFEMGSRQEEGNGYERLQHKVEVSPFWMSKYPITQAQWEKVASFDSVGDLNKINSNRKVYEVKSNPSKFTNPNNPVELVTWYQAIEFCARLSKKFKKNYRLPSEAEWEYACRAGKTTPFYFGETITDKLANYNAIGTYESGPIGIYRKKTTEVGTFSPNGFGLYDMHGNVWEWCLDPWHDNYYEAPTDGRVWDDNNQAFYQNIVENIDELWKLKDTRINRGGSWRSYPNDCRSAYRNKFYPDLKFDNLGFRVVLGVPRT